MQIRCPHCHNQIDATDDTSLAEVNCPNCGSSFSLLVGDATQTHRAESRRIAHFELIRELGIGKFGAVWMARDTQLDRTVAIKIPRKGALDADEAEKFLRDARAAAQLHHPNIVGVHEVGREGDTVYIVTDYIKGANLREWLTGQRLSSRESAELLVKVARALHHAHESGVVHRDLKPGNIMIDGDSQPHVIDFGLAKRDAGEITMTVDGHILGTPAYMSPEQAAGRGHQADRRSDVYSLGVILFELLTGELPFRGETQMLLLQIERDDPPRPRKLNGKIPRDLETITLKCLQKEPGRRYQSAEKVAEDLANWVAGKPIVARPVSRAERGWRWCKRNRAVAGFAAATVFALLSGASLSSYFAVRATAERDRADAKAAEAITERERAESGFRAAREAVDKYYTTVSESTLLDVPGMQPLRKELLESALEYYQKATAETGEDPAVQAEMASAYSRLANITRQIGSQDQSLAEYQKAMRLYEKLVSAHPTVSAYQGGLAAAYIGIAYIKRDSNDRANAEVSSSKAVELYEKLVRDDPGVSDYQRGLAKSYFLLGTVQRDGQSADREALFEKSIATYERVDRDSPRSGEFRDGLIWAYLNLGNMRCGTNRKKEGVALLNKAVELGEDLVRQYPSVANYKNGLAEAYRSIGRYSSRKADVQRFLQKGLDVLESLVHDNPTVAEYRHRLANLYCDAGSLQYAAGDLPAAEVSYRKAVGLIEGVVRENPAVGLFHQGLGSAYGCLWATQLGLGRTKEAAATTDQATAFLNELIKTIAADTRDTGALATTYVTCGNAYAMSKLWSKAADAFGTAAKLLDYPSDYLWQWAMLQAAAGDTEGYRAACALLLARYGDTQNSSLAFAIAVTCVVDEHAVDDMAQVLALANLAVKSSPINPGFLTALGSVQYRIGDDRAAVATLKRALPLHSIAALAAPGQLDQIQASRVACATFLTLALHRDGDQTAYAAQLAATRSLLAELEKSPPPPGQSIGPWAIVFAIENAKRELARVDPLESPEDDHITTSTNPAN